MLAQQRLRLIQQLSFVFGAGTLITPPQLLQDLVPCRPTYHFIHSRHGNSHFWRNVSFFPSLHPLPGNKTFGAIREEEWEAYLFDSLAVPLQVISWDRDLCGHELIRGSSFVDT